MSLPGLRLAFISISYLAWQFLSIPPALSALLLVLLKGEKSTMRGAHKHSN